MSGIPPVLLIDDQDADRGLTERILRESFPSLRIEEVSGATGLSRALVRRSFGLVISELTFSWAKGLDVISTLIETVPNCPIIVLSSEQRVWEAVEALQRGAEIFIPKTPRGFLDLPEAIRTVQFRSHQRQVREGGDAPHRALLDSLPIGVFTATREGEILEANPAMATALGFPGPGSLIRKRLQDLLLEKADAQRLEAELDSSGAVSNAEMVIRRDDGGTSWIRLHAWLVNQESTGLSQIQGTVEDITRERRAHEELARRAENLRTSSWDLEQFASAISHDLREPLHIMRRFAQNLSEGYGETLDAKGSRYVERIIEGAERLQRMIDGIHELSRIDSHGERFTPIDLETVLEEALSNLAESLENSSAKITHDLLPTLSVDQPQMVQLFQNLIGNAIKFCKKRTPEVHIGASERADDWLFSVADNGIGIPPEETDRIFEVFQRLHTEDEFPGLGVGLALCRRIVDRHGGSIWFESRPGQGTTFYFTISKTIGQWP